LEQTDPSASLLSPEEKKAALEAALASETFARPEQLRAFLRFVCEMEMSGRAAAVTEYLIGVKALGRPKDYSPLEDSSVRTRAHELRQRLQKYYANENPDAIVRIELPKGAYTPRFVVGPPAAPVESHTAPPPSPTAETPSPRRFPWAAGSVAGFLAGCILASLVAWTVVGRIQGPGVEPALKRAWAPLTSKDPEILICIGSPLHMLVTPYLGTVPDSLPRYPAPDELYALFSRYRNLPKDARLEMQPVQKAVPMGDLDSVARVLATLQALHAQFRILPETNSPLTALRRRSVVLFGSPWYSRSAAVLLEKTPWTTRWDETTRQIGLFGQGPREGKRFVPMRGPHGQYQEVFGLVTVLPNDITSDGARSIVVFSGLTSVGTHGAATFFTSGTDLKNLEERFRREGVNRWPKSYQVVVRCRASDDTQLLSYAYETHEIIIK
jgi:hypothetical protein